MFAICIEASHSKGMGHLFRMLNFVEYLKKKNQQFIFVVNDNKKTINMLTNSDIAYKVVDIDDSSPNWESKIINEFDIKYWINDRLDTNQLHSLNVKKTGINLITFDDLGEGAKNSDINVCGLFFNREEVEGKLVLRGVEYLILNSEIDLYKRERESIKNILVTLGGSDTYGVTIKALKILQDNNINASIHIGPSFEHINSLEDILTDQYELINNVPSLVEEFAKYDLAITGGGITPFEANASGLPCLVIANESFEITNGYFLDKIGSSKFLGFYDGINKKVFKNINSLNIKEMSRFGLDNLNTGAVGKIYQIIKEL